MQCSQWKQRTKLASPGHLATLLLCLIVSSKVLLRILRLALHQWRPRVCVYKGCACDEGYLRPAERVYVELARARLRVVGAIELVGRRRVDHQLVARR